MSSRGIERACREHVTFIALCGDTPPHFTTIADFVSTRQAEIARVFAAVVAICDQQGLIGRAMFAIDGVKLPSNASKQRSGTREDFERQAIKLTGVVATMLQRHRETDTAATEPTLDAEAVGRGVKGPFSRAIGPTTRAQRWRRAKECFRALPASPPSMRPIRSSSTRKRTARAPSRHCCSPW